MNKLKHYLFTGYNDPEIQWCRANTIVLALNFVLFVALFSLIGGI